MFYSKYESIVMCFGNPGYNDEVLQEVSRNGPYNLVILSQILMHVKDLLELLKTVRTVMADDGIVYIKVVEDGLKTCHPGEETLQRVISLYQEYKYQTPNYRNDARTDRYCGHKTYTYLIRSGFTDIKHFIAFTDTVSKDFDERMEEYEMFASFRLRNKEKMPASIRESLEENLNILKELFKQEDFYFATPTMYFTAKRGKIS